MNEFEKWNYELYNASRRPLSKGDKDYIRNFFKALGFTKVRVLKNGYVNATKDKTRYFGLYVHSEKRLQHIRRAADEKS